MGYALSMDIFILIVIAILLVVPFIWMAKETWNEPGIDIEKLNKFLDKNDD